MGARDKVLTSSLDWQFWSEPLASALTRLTTSVRGLSAQSAALRLKEHGTNSIEAGPRQSLVFGLLKRFQNPLVAILLVSAGVAGATGDIASFFIISAVVLLSVLLDFVQERRALVAADRLRARVALTTSVLRDDRQQVIPSASLVPGDVITLAAGDLVPGDCRLIESRDLFVNQSLLTGEAFPAAKTPDIAADSGDVVPQNGVFMGSSVVSGTASALVVRTGHSTMLGSIAGQLRHEPPRTAFAVALREFSFLVVRITFFLVLFVLLANLLLQRPPLISFLFALALAVGLTPELLPMIVSVTLAHGAIRMSKKQVIVKRLSAIHDLGSMDVLCSDKTGTLTKASISLVSAVDLDGAKSEAVHEAAFLNAKFETGIRSPLDEALLASATFDSASWKKIDEVPFDFERRRVSILVERAGQRRLIVKGAPEDVLRISTHRQVPDGAAPLTSQDLERARKALADYGRQGLRVLGIAWRDVQAPHEQAGQSDESGLVFGGFALFLDPPKDDAAKALSDLKALGVEVKVLTGDNEHVTAYVCEAIGLEEGETLTGAEISILTDDALRARLRTANKFCRVSPAQKLRVISALRQMGRVVGYIGDGINDAPSLHAADVGLSVDGAVDVAKDAASMIMLENDLSVIADGVREGRRTFANIQKYIMMETSSNFGNVFSMAGGVLFLPFLPMLPVQILLNNLIYDLSEITIPTDDVDPEVMKRPRSMNVRFVRNFMLTLGPVSSLFDFLTFALLLWGFGVSAAEFRTGWFIESLAAQCLVILVIRTRGNPFKSRPGGWLMATTFGAVLAATALPYTGIGHWFGFTPVSTTLLFALAATTVAYLVLAELAKRWFFRHYSSSL